MKSNQRWWGNRNYVPNFQLHFVSLLCILQVLTIILSNDHCALTNGLEWAAFSPVASNGIIRLATDTRQQIPMQSRAHVTNSKIYSISISLDKFSLFHRILILLLFFLFSLINTEVTLFFKLHTHAHIRTHEYTHKRYKIKNEHQIYRRIQFERLKCFFSLFAFGLHFSFVFHLLWNFLKLFT